MRQKPRCGSLALPVVAPRETQHRHRAVRARHIGVARADGLFDIVWTGGGLVRPDPYFATTRFEEPSLREWA